MTRPIEESPRAALDGVVLAALGAVLYLALGQDAFHGVDAHEFLQRLGRGEPWHRYHFLYLPITFGIAEVLAPFGLTIFEAARAASALGCAFGVFFMHCAARAFGLGRGDALAVAVLCATAPATVFFATVVEVHGVFCAFVGLGWWAGAHLIATPNLRRAAVLGVATGLAASTHATGHLFFGLVLLVWLAKIPSWEEFGWARIAGIMLVGGLIHIVLFLGIGAWLQQPGMNKPAGAQFEMIWDSLRRSGSPGRWLEITWNEWLWGYVPLSLASLAGLLARTQRPLAIAVLLTVVVYTVAIAPMLIYYSTDERGAYYLPLALPSALLAIALLPRPGVWAAAVLSLGLGVFEVVRHDDPGLPDQYAVDLLAACGEETPVLLYGDTEEGRAALRVDASVPSFNIAEVEDTLRKLDGSPEQKYQQFCLFFDAQVADATRAGRVFVLTDSTHAWLSAPGATLVSRFMSEHVPKNYKLSRLEHGQFSGHAVRPR